MITYDPLAWERTPGAFGGASYDEPYRRNLVNWILELNPESVVDAGCLDGHLVRELRRYGYQGRYVGFDVTLAFIVRALAMSPEERFFVADARRPFSLQGDLVVLANVIMHLDDPAVAIREAFSAADRWVIISTYSSPSGEVDCSDGFINRWLRPEDVTLAMPAGWEVVKWKHFRPSWLSERPWRSILQVLFRKNFLREGDLVMKYHSTGIQALDHVLGGGVVPGKTNLLGGRRGVGKTTMFLQACYGFAERNEKRAYFASGEMTKDDVTQYAQRLKFTSDNVRIFCDPRGLDLDDLFMDVVDFGARLLVVDSIQVSLIDRSNVKADIGSHVMIKNAVNMLASFAPMKKCAVFGISHLNANDKFPHGYQLLNMVDGALLMDALYCSGVDTKVRHLHWDGKSRQCRDDLESLIRITPDGLIP